MARNAPQGRTVATPRPEATTRAQATNSLLAGLLTGVRTWPNVWLLNRHRFAWPRHLDGVKGVMADLERLIDSPLGSGILAILIIVTVVRWIFLPFAVFGIKQRIDKVRKELRRANELLEPVGSKSST